MKNPKAVLARKARWRAAHRDEINEIGRAYRLANLEKDSEEYLDAIIEYWFTNPAERRAAKQAVRAEARNKQKKAAL